MLDNLLDLVKQHAGEAIINNPVIPTERNDEAIASPDFRSGTPIF